MSQRFLTVLILAIASITARQALWLTDETRHPEALLGASVRTCPLVAAGLGGRTGL